jgi:hypothetical protein
MINYESTKNKIRKTWQQTTNNENDADKLESGLVKWIPLYYDKTINQYIVYDGTISNDDPIIYKVKLKYFPETILPNLKPILISSSASSIIESYQLDTTLYIIYQGAATIKITLNITNPQDAK